MQHVTAHHAFRAAMKLTAYVDRAAPTNLMFSNILSLDDFEIWAFFVSDDLNKFCGCCARSSWIDSKNG